MSKRFLELLEILQHLFTEIQLALLFCALFPLKGYTVTKSPLAAGSSKPRKNAFILLEIISIAKTFYFILFAMRFSSSCLYSELERNIYIDICMFTVKPISSNL